MKLKYLYSGIKGILKYGGLKSFISRTFQFIQGHTFVFEEYYIIYMNSHRVPEDIEGDFLPKEKNIYCATLTTNKEADDLVTQGFNFGTYEANLRARFDKGVLSFCIFMNKEFAHVSCLANNPKGKVVVDNRPFDVDYQNGEAIVGRAHTIPKFRRLHLRTYNGYLIRKYCRENGIDRVLSTVNARNIAALATAPESPDRYIKSKFRLTKVLFFTHIKETKVDATTIRQVVAQIDKK